MKKNYISIYNMRMCLEKISFFVLKVYHWEEQEYYIKFLFSYFGKIFTKNGKEITMPEEFASFKITKIQSDKADKNDTQEFFVIVGLESLVIKRIEINEAFSRRFP